MKVKVKCKGAGLVDIDNLEEFQADLKILSEEDADKLRGNIVRDGFIAPIFVWKNPSTGTSHILDGHQRLFVLKLLREQGWEIPKIPVDYVIASSLKDAKRKLLQILSQFGRVTKGGLEHFIEAAGIDLADLKFEISIPGVDLRFAAHETGGDDSPPAKPKKAVSKTGQVWLLGEHLFVCYDRPNKVGWWKGGADLCITDEPKGGASWSSVFRAMREGGTAYVFYTDEDPLPTLKGLKEAGFALVQQIVWVKDTYEVSRLAYSSRHEPVIVGRKPGRDMQKGAYIVKPGKKPTLNGAKRETVWEYPRPLASKKYPTLKPVDLYVRAILDSSNPGDVLLDPWAGTGTCLIAAQKTGRKCVAFEKDPALFDVAVERFQTWCKANGIEIECRQV